MDPGTKKIIRWIVWTILAVLVAIALLIPLGCWYLAISAMNQLGHPPSPYDPMEYIGASPPQWAPDGSRIIFAHEGDIYAVDQDGSSLSRIHGSDLRNDVQTCPFISGDGSRIAYSKFQGGDYEYNARWSRMTSALDGSDIRKNAEDLDGQKFNDHCPRNSISPDGSRVAFVRSESRGPDGIGVTVLYVNEYPREVDDFGVELALNADINSVPKWSPDGSQLAFVKWDYVPDEDNLYSWQVMALSGSELGTIHQVADGFLEYAGWRSGGRRAGVYGLAWSPDGLKLLISVLNSISVVNVDGTGLRTIVNLRSSGYRPGYPRRLSASWSPDGSKIAVYNRNGYEGALFTMSPDGSGKRVLAPYGDPLRPAENQAWDPLFEATPTPNPIATPTPAPTSAPPSG